jgi:predicted RNase H-like HicB family nuclease
MPIDTRYHQFKRPVNAGRVTVPGKPSDVLTPCTLGSILKQSGLRSEILMRYAIVIEKPANNYSAYVPDLPGCVATGATVVEEESQIREAIAIHLDGLREDGISLPETSRVVEYLEIAA